jgi:hypothetical protein
VSERHAPARRLAIERIQRREPRARREPARQHLLGDRLHATQPLQVQIAGLHAHEERALALVGAERGEDRRRRGEELALEAQPLAASASRSSMRCDE